ncbi:MAG: hypothetical protein WC178_02855 [Candidatus Paceibacterota bacterium]
MKEIVLRVWQSGMWQSLESLRDRMLRLSVVSQKAVGTVQKSCLKISISCGSAVSDPIHNVFKFQ